MLRRGSWSGLEFAPLLVATFAAGQQVLAQVSIVSGLIAGA